MDFNYSGQSYELSPSTFSNSDDDDDELIIQTVITNNNYVAQLIAQQNPTIRRGSVPGHIVINRNREVADRNLFNDYFSEHPTYGEAIFRRRFRMSRSLFLRIADAVKNHDNYFVQRCDATGKVGLSTFQKITAALRMLAYGAPADATDEYIRIGESTAIQCLKRFCRDVIEVFGEQYLRSPTANDVARLLHIGKQRGFPGMLGSLDCMHWRWKNCPTGWSGHYAGRSGHSTIILEAVADYDLWIWHANFGMPGANNDINVLEASNLFSNLSKGIAPPANYVIQGKEYNTGYYLAAGIYPKWSTLVQTIREPRGPKRKYFAMKQESCRKDVERAFGVLQSRFAIVAAPARFWEKKDLHSIMTACIIMHNMIIEDERNLDAPIQCAMEAPTPDVEMVIDDNAVYQKFLVNYRAITNKEAHIALRDALIDHLWEEYTNSES